MAACAVGLAWTAVLVLAAGQHRQESAHLLPSGVFVGFEATAADGHGIIEVRADGRAITVAAPISTLADAGGPPLPVCALRLSHHVVRYLRALIRRLPRPATRLIRRSPDGFFYVISYRKGLKRYLIALAAARDLPKRRLPSLPRSSPIWHLARYMKILLHNHAENPPPNTCRL